jgi:uncharacterized damage-inducible protein DinB
MKPSFKDVPKWYRGYADIVPDKPLMEVLNESEVDLLATIGHLSEEQSQYRYQPTKWSIKDLIMHICDAERVFAYRALRFIRNDQTDLSGFDQDMYVDQGQADHRSLDDLVEEFKSVRKATKLLFKHHLNKLDNQGTVDGNKFTVGVLGYVIVGHLLHHLVIIKQKYLPGL